VGVPSEFSVFGIDPSTNTVVKQFGIPPGANPSGEMAMVGRTLLVSSGHVVASISAIDTTSGEVTVIPLDSFAESVVVVERHAWWTVPSSTTATTSLVRIDEGSTAPAATTTLDGVTAIGITAGFDSIWLADTASGAVLRYPMSFLDAGG
jgi:hypothetical protein